MKTGDAQDFQRWLNLPYMRERQKVWKRFLEAMWAAKTEAEIEQIRSRGLDYYAAFEGKITGDGEQEH